MPSISFTYDALKEALEDWTEDSFTDFTSELDTIIGLAEVRCYRDLALEVFDETDTSKATVSGNAELALADDAILLRSLYVDDRLVLPRSESYVRHYQGISPNSHPLYFNQHSDTTLLLAPVPDSAYSTRQRVMKRPAGLSSTNPTTFLSTHAGDLLFAACKVQSAIFHKATEEGGNDAAPAEAEYQALLPAARMELRHLARTGYP